MPVLDSANHHVKPSAGGVTCLSVTRAVGRRWDAHQSRRTTDEVNTSYLVLQAGIL